MSITSKDPFQDLKGFLKRQAGTFKTNILRNQLIFFALALTTQYHPIYLTALGANPLTLGYLNALIGVIYTATAIPAGVLADKHGLKKVIMGTLLISILATFLFGIADSWQVASLGLLLIGLSTTLDMTTCPMICGSLLQPRERSTGMGICDSLSFLPSLAAPILAAGLITILGGMNIEGIRPLFFLQIAILLAAFVVMSTRFENPPIQLGGRKSNPFKDLKFILTEGKYVKKWLVVTSLSYFPFQVLFYTPLFAAEVMGADQFIVGGLGMATSLVMVFLAIPMGHMADKYGKKNVIIASSLLVILSRVLLINASNNMVILLSGLLGGFITSLTPSQTAISADLVPHEYLGSWFGIIGFFRGIMNIISPLICGYVWEVYSPQSMFILLAAVQALHVLVVITIPKDIEKR